MPFPRPCLSPPLSAWLMGRFLAVILWGCLGLHLPAFALDPTLKLSQYQHTSWAGKEGAPSEVTHIVETTDGFLWLATPEGLVRFDGVTFERVESLGGDTSIGSEIVRVMCADASGGIWLSFAFDHGVALYKDHRFTRYPGRYITGCVEVDGATWMISNNHLARFEKGKFEDVGSRWGIPVIINHSLFVDEQKTLWTFDRQSDVLWYLRRGETRFHKFQASAIPVASVVMPGNRLWGTSILGLTEVTLEGGVPTSSRWLSHRAMGAPMVDRDGGFWASDTHGLLHVGSTVQVRNDPDGRTTTEDAFTVAQGLGADTVWHIVEDRNGSVWVGTSAGLERFRAPTLIPVKVPGRTIAFGMAPAADGSVWTANWTSDVLRVDRHANVRTIHEGSLTPSTGTSGLFLGIDRSVWIASGAEALWHMGSDDQGTLTPIPPTLAGNNIFSVTQSRDGAIWVSYGQSAGVVRLQDGQWTRPSGTGIPKRWTTARLFADRAGQIWSAQRDTVLLVQENVGRTLDKATAGLDVGDVIAFHERNGGEGMWVGGSTGIALFDGSRFHALNVEGEAPPRQVNDILQSANGDLWWHGRNDAFRVDAAELQKFYAHPETKVSARRFDALDGLTGTTSPTTARSSLIEGSDGLIWFSSSTGLAYFDPSKPAPKAAVPRVFIKSIASGDQRLPVDLQSVKLAPLSKSITVSYTATDLAIPERVRFRHRLDGVDGEWREAGSRREATYTDLSPGDYRLHVRSSDETGGWTGPEATVDFRIPPAWFQTWAFRLLVGVLVGLALWLLYRMRVAQVTARVRWELKTQQAERDRIARELHDTLLQGVQGLIWRFQTLAARLPSDNPVRYGMESALDSADSMLAESRDRVRDLRAPAPSPLGLVERLREIGDGFAIDHPATCTTECRGAEREVTWSAQKEICDITREALSNAFSHSKASEVRVTVTFDQLALEVVVADDGVGIKHDVLRSGKALHFGLAGMRERAGTLRAEFELISALSTGTQVRLAVPASVAYERGPAVQQV